MSECFAISLCAFGTAVKSPSLSLLGTKNLRYVSLRFQDFQRECNNREILLIVSGFDSNADAASYFVQLQDHLIKWSFHNSLPLTIPEDIELPQRAKWNFIEKDFRCIAKGWPPRAIQPLVISNYGASVYPEHEFVAIAEIFKMRPQRIVPSKPFGKTLDAIIFSPADLSSNHLLAAVANYTHAANSFQHVWSFLLSVTTLEMLALVSKSNAETRIAVTQLVKHARETLSTNREVDIERIVACLNQANTESITSSVKTLVRTNCLSPDTPTELASELYSAEECDRKVSAIYAIRSKYAHEGRIKAKQIKPSGSFWELKATTMLILKHILSRMLASTNGTIEN
jgi:hypothetical protein